MNWKQRSAEYMEKYAARLGSNLLLQPWKPEAARGASKGGQWICGECCQTQRGSKAAHKRMCPGFTPYVRTSAK